MLLTCPLSWLQSSPPGRRGVARMRGGSLASPAGLSLEPSPGQARLERLSGNRDESRRRVARASRITGTGKIDNVKLRYVRGGDVLADDEDVVVRGGELDATVLRQDAQRNHEVYGVYGISVFVCAASHLMRWRSRSPSSTSTA